MRRYHSRNSRRNFTREKGFRPGVEIRSLAAKAASTWRNSSTLERVGLGAVSLATASVAGVALTVLAHVSAFVALSILPIVFFPFFFVIAAASIGTVFFAGLSLSGLGFLFLWGPIVAAGTIVKLGVNLLVFSVVASVVAKFVMDKAGKGIDLGAIFGEQSGPVSSAVDIEWEPEQPSPRDQFRNFDELLHNRLETDPRASRRLSSWTVDDVVDDMIATGLGEYTDVFLRERIDGEVLFHLTEDDVREEFAADIPLGDRLKLLRWIRGLQRNQRF